MLPKLRDVVEKVLEAGDMTQPELAQKLFGTEKRQGKISAMMGANDKSGWEKHWQACARLVPLAVSLGVLTERDLLGLPSHESQPDGSSKTGRAKANQR